MSIAEKIIKASENVYKVYEAGQSSMVDESKLIPKSVSGHYISLDDVSEIPHKVECKVSSGSVAPETVQVIKFGKNLIPYPFVNFTRESNGITATDLGDGGVLLNGTAATTVFIYLHKTPIGNLYIEGSRTFDIGGTKCAITANKHNSAIRTVHHNNNHLTYIIIDAGTVCDNIVFYPQIEVGAVTTEFEKGIPYEVFTPSANGMVEGMTSASPYMNLFCNTADVTLDVEYNKSYGMYKCEQTHEAIKEEGISEGKKAEHDRFWDAFQMNGKRTDYAFGFAGEWNKDIFYPKYDIITSNNVNNMFYQFGLSSQVGAENTLNLIERAKECGITISFGKLLYATYMFYYAKISHIPALDLTNHTNKSVATILNNARYTKYIEKIIVSEELKYQNAAFKDMLVLEEVRFEGVIGNSIAFAESSKLSKDSITNIIQTLSATTTGQTLTLNENAVNDAFTESEWALLIAEKPNWTISLV